MKLLGGLLALAFAPVAVQAKSVFAHFMVGNTEEFKVDDWKHEISLAQAARIDAFAMNMAYDDNVVEKQLPMAFQAAESLGFALFFSFDYAGNGPWDKDTVKHYLQTYTGSRAYFKYNGKPFVSTFEGPENSQDWVDIKSSSGCFFIPDWSSLGAKEAMALGTADGLFSWEGWPSGPRSTSTYGDASYLQYLEGRPYMAPVSPWFYTNMPGYNKNWQWRGDSLWFDRWQQLIMAEYQHEFLQIISWNDYGESHYIGPLDDRQYVAFGPKYGKAPFNYVKNMPHDGWRQFLPFLIELWKTGTASVGTEGVTAWFRPNPVNACSDGGTTGNTANQLQLEYTPAEITEDKVFYSALLGSEAEVTVFIGGRSIAGSWSTKPYGGVGLYHGSVNMDGSNGNVIVQITRNGNTVMKTSGKGAITAGCESGLTNFNAYVDSGAGGSSSARTPKNIKDLVPTEGTGAFAFKEMCEFTCKYGYCPQGACTALNKGDQREKPPSTGVKGYPVEGASGAFIGLCDYACNLGFCPSERCGLEKKPTYEGSVSPFVAPACTSGTGSGNLQGLCDYSCNWGFCPMRICKCLTTGPLHLPTPEQDSSIKGAMTTDGTLDYGLCAFACTRGYCPEPCKAIKTLPGGVFIPTDPNGDWSSMGDTLLSIFSDYTRVHMNKEASDSVKSVLSSQSVSVVKRGGTHPSDLLLLRTVTSLLSNRNVVSLFVGLYRGNPIPGTLGRIIQIPAFSYSSMVNTFLNGLSTASLLLKQAVPDMSTEEMIWIYYAMMDTADHYTSSHPANFLNFAIGRSGNMPNQCPDVEDTECYSPLCNSQDGAFCNGFITMQCACETRCKVKFSETELLPFCEATNCRVNHLTGLCTVPEKYEHCPCVGHATIDTYKAINRDKLHQVWIGPDHKGGNTGKPDSIKCYKPERQRPEWWRYMEQKVLDSTIDKFCDSHGQVSKGGAGGSSEKGLNSGTLNMVDISFEYEEGATLTVNECKNKLKQLSASCDWSDTENQYNWKWGGEFTTGLFKYTIEPTAHRFPVRSDPDTNWWRLGDSRHYWNNGKTTSGIRTGKNGKSYDMIIINQCIHHLRLHNWDGGAAHDCGGIVDISMSRQSPYGSHDDCFDNTWQMMAYKMYYEPSTLCGYSNHKAGADGPAGATCWAGISCTGVK